MKFKLLVNWKLKALFITGLLLVSFGTIQAQTITVKGVVTGDGEPLPGVSVLVKGTSNGTVTDFDGNYQITTDSNSTLLVSYIGFVAQEIAIKGQQTINVQLISDVSTLEEVVVIGYGTQKKKEVTGAVARIEAETLIESSTADLGTALQGQIAGVTVTASDGQPGSESNIVIRGISSIEASNSPLYIVDGIPFESDPKLSLNEIETIDVLKDAASAAIYGTRGAAGVILITTKQGKMGQMNISADSYYGVQNITSGLPLADLEESLYITFLSGAANNNTHYNNTWTPLEQGTEQFTNNTNLRDVIQQNFAAIQNHGLRISGGKDGLAYSITGNYFSQDGIIINTGYDRINVRANTQFTKGKWKIDTGLGFRIEEQEYAAWGLLTDAYKYKPYQQEIDPNATTVQTPGGGNQNETINLSNISTKLQQTDVRNGESLNANITANYKINSDFRFTTRFGMAYTNNTRVRINPLFQVFNEDGDEVPVQQRSGAWNQSNRSAKATWENFINYTKSFGDHNLKVLALYSAEKYNYTSFFASKKDFFSNEITTLEGALRDADAGTGTRWEQDRTNTLIGSLLRVQYNYKGKYLLSLSARRDGSSRFAPENRYKIFPSASVGWNVSDEAFWQPAKSVVNSFKVRASHGTTGNQGILDYSYQPTIVLNQDAVFGPEDTDNLALGATQLAYKNRFTQWETSIQDNIGIDFGFFKNQLTLNADIYKTVKQDMLFPLLVPPTNGSWPAYKTVTLNTGDMENKGLELALNYRHKGKFNWNIGMTYSKNKNTITKMTGTNKISYIDGSNVADNNNEDLVSVIAEGYEAGAFFLIKTDGVISTEEELADYQANVNPTAKIGDLKMVDANGDGEISIDDRRYAGSGTPDYTVGLNFNANYKGFDFSMQWYGSFGAEIMNGSKAFAYKFATHKDLVYQWTPQNAVSTIPTNRGRDHNNYRGFTDYWLEDGSYIRLRNVNLGYTVPRKITETINVTKLRLFVAAQNPLTFTKYTGFDPEIGGNNLATRGIDRGSYPITSQFRLGVQLDF
ncbi:SusC/RagA family TonB-linked outer membrane protein [Flavicella marina]|uniref:SusC/RagA family TonB-linked outer membrane protein n=1 Tax=Flavicella marina TaxID=1475951 RepID=UPI0012654AB6|nr:TonB-dependent receptor [Flavicella marina]